jgi:hypothetical protein
MFRWVALGVKPERRIQVVPPNRVEAIMPNDRYEPNDQYAPNDRYKGWAASAAIIMASLLIAGVFLHTWVGERTRAANASQVSASLTPGEVAPAR